MRGPRGGTVTSEDRSEVASAAVDASIEPELDVEEVLAEGSLRTAFQPICGLESRVTVGFEALARFPDTTEATTPRHWFEQAARLGLVHDLELLAAETALAQFDRLPESSFLAVNLSPSTASSRAVADLVATVEAARLVIDIAEHSEVDSRHFLEAIDHLRSLGVRIALDDAGASDVALHRLVGLRPDIVKVDTSIVHGIAADELRQAVAYAYASLAERTGAICLAEGVETEEELEVLLTLGITMGQGYLLGRPEFLAD